MAKALKDIAKEFAESIQAEEGGLTRNKILYYNAFTEDLFYWDNDLDSNQNFKLKIQPNSFISWIIEDQGQDQNIISHFQHYTNDKITPSFLLSDGHILFTIQSGDGEDRLNEQIKLSKGEESNFIWSIFYTLLELVISELDILEPDERSTREFDDLEYLLMTRFHH